MRKYRIFKNSDYQGEIVLHDLDSIGLLGKANPDFAQEFLGYEKTGVMTARDVFEEDSKTQKVQKRLVKKGEKGYGSAFLSHLRRQGYEVTPDGGDIKAEIIKLLEEFKGIEEEKRGFLRKLSGMSYLEASTLLETLKICKESPEKFASILNK